MYKRQALQRAVQDGLIRTNPAEGCKLPPKKAREMQVLARDEMCIRDRRKPLPVAHMTEYGGARCVRPRIIRFCAVVVQNVGF